MSTLTATPPSAATPVPQHLQALARANLIRLARAELKQRVRSGDTSAAEVVRTCPFEAETMTVANLLRAQRNWGRTRARKFLASLVINENKPLHHLTKRQRQQLAYELERKRRSPRS